MLRENVVFKRDQFCLFFKIAEGKCCFEKSQFLCLWSQFRIFGAIPEHDKLTLFINWEKYRIPVTFQCNYVGTFCGEILTLLPILSVSIYIIISNIQKVNYLCVVFKINKGYAFINWADHCVKISKLTNSILNCRGLYTSLNGNSWVGKYSGRKLWTFSFFKWESLELWMRWSMDLWKSILFDIVIESCNNHNMNVATCEKDAPQ